MTSFVDTPTRIKTGAPLRPRLSPLKWNRWHVTLQVIISLACAVVLISLVFALIPQVAISTKNQLHLAAHEGGHALLALLQMGEVHDITLRADGSGEVSSSATDTVLTAGGGLLLPITIATILIISGVTRTMIGVLSLSLAVPLFWLGYDHAHIPEVRWAMWGWATFCLFIALPGVPHVIKAAGILAIGLTLLIGAYDELGYLAQDYIADPDAITALTAISDVPQMPTDVRLIADAFGEDSIDNVRTIILFLMAAICFAALCVITRFLTIYRKR